MIVRYGGRFDEPQEISHSRGRRQRITDNLKTILEHAYTVAVFDSGQSALTYAPRAEIYAAFVDYAMPLMDGAEVCKRLRAIDPTISLIGISGNDRPDFGTGLFVVLEKKHATANKVREIAQRAVEAAARLKNGGGSHSLIPT